MFDNTSVWPVFQNDEGTTSVYGRVWLRCNLGVLSACGSEVGRVMVKVNEMCQDV